MYSLSSFTINLFSCPCVWPRSVWRIFFFLFIFEVVQLLSSGALLVDYYTKDHKTGAAFYVHSFPYFKIHRAPWLLSAHTSSACMLCAIAVACMLRAFAVACMLCCVPVSCFVVDADIVHLRLYLFVTFYLLCVAFVSLLCRFFCLASEPG